MLSIKHILNKNGKKITYILLYINYWWYCVTFLFYILYRYSFVFGTISQITFLITAVLQTYWFVVLRKFNTVEENNNRLIIIRLVCVQYKSEMSVGLYYCYTHVIISRVTDVNRYLDVMEPATFRG